MGLGAQTCPTDIKLGRTGQEGRMRITELSSERRRLRKPFWGELEVCNPKGISGRLAGEEMTEAKAGPP